MDTGADMPIALEITPRTTGRPEMPLAATFVRELVIDDLQALEAVRGTSQPSALKRLTDRHHGLARIIASGNASREEAALTMGYVPGRVSVLMSDPAFKELVNFYRNMKDKEFRDVHQRLVGVTADALDEISDRLEDETTRKAMSMNTLTDLVKLGADRTGFGPQSSTTNVSVHIGVADRLEAARRRAREAAAGLVVEAEAKDITPPVRAEATSLAEATSDASPLPSEPAP